MKVRDLCVQTELCGTGCVWHVGQLSGNERGRQELQDHILQMIEKEQSNAAKTAPTLGQNTTPVSSDYRRPSRFGDSQPSARDMPDKHARSFQDAPPRPSGPSDNRSSFQGYSQPPTSAPLAQSGIGDFLSLIHI